MTRDLAVLDEGQLLTFSFADLMRYHGPRFPGGVAHAFKVLERALPLLAPDSRPERREITVRTAFTGPGARDAIELVTRAATEDRYTVDPALERPDRGRTLERYVFRLSYRDRTVTLILREGLVREEFIDLSRKQGRTVDDEDRLTVLKQEMADRLLACPPIEVYDVDNAIDT